MTFSILATGAGIFQVDRKMAAPAIMTTKVINIILVKLFTIIFLPRRAFNCESTYGLYNSPATVEKDYISHELWQLFGTSKIPHPKIFVFVFNGQNFVKQFSHSILPRTW